MKHGRPQAKDLGDEEALRAVRAVRGRHVALVSSLWDVQDELAVWPTKVVLAKLRSLVRRGVLSGCVCGCRGNFAEKP
jgi:hypothetical protein